MRLEGRVVVVTGAASGIGAATCRALREHGADVVGVDRTQSGTAGRAVHADLSEPAGVDAAVDQLPERIDGLCAVAGVPGTAGLDRVRAVNYLGLRHLVSRVLERMTPGGSIAVAASIAGSRWRDRVELHAALAESASYDDGLAWCRAHPIDDGLAYPYFKEAVIVWARHEAARLVPRGIRVNCVSPGPVETPILDDFRASLGTERVGEDIARVGRAGVPDDVAGAFAFLMSSDSSWVNGVDLACDGGLAAVIGSTQPAVAPR